MNEIDDPILRIGAEFAQKQKPLRFTIGDQSEMNGVEKNATGNGQDGKREI